MINFYAEDVSKPSLPIRKVKRWIKLLIELKDFKIGELSIIFCSDNFLLDYNKRFLQHDYFTDIITFNYNEQGIIAGDLFISVDTVRKNANEFNTNEIDEFLRVIIHGVLHLVGYNDHTEEEIIHMREQEAKAMELYHILTK